MLKHVYKLILLIAVFAISVFFFGKNIKEVRIDVNETVSMKEATFPIVSLKTGGYLVNQLHGYSVNLEANMVREAITPLGIDKTFQVLIEEKGSNIKKLNYEVCKVENNEVIDSGAISALDEIENGESAEIKIKENLETSKEYAVKMTAITDTSKKIHFYTRIKYYEEDFFLKEKMNFVLKFHKAIMDKKKAETITQYLEPSSYEENDSLSHVNIHSSFDLISWGKLKPTIITDVVPTVKEINIETAAIQLSYYVKAKTATGEELYQVKEFYRVRFTLNRIYLLNYERTMEELFNMDLVSISKSELKIGISNDSNLEIVATEDNNKMCFVRQGALWYYNMPENKAVKVFSFLGDTNDYTREGYDQHNIRVLNMDSHGNIDFLVYGYMNRGDYEGKVALVLYKYFANENRIEEQVYAPIETTYQILKEDLNSFSFVNKKGVFFFALNDQVYSYNIIAKKLTVIAQNMKEDNFIMLEKGKSIAWLDSADPSKAKSITIMNLETEQTRVIPAKEGETIRLFGEVDSNIIYGFAKTTNITEAADGTIIIPVYELAIADMKGTILKQYSKKNIFIKESTVSNNIIKLTRMKKKIENGKTIYYQIADDSILTKMIEDKEQITLTDRVTEAAYKEIYISLPKGFNMKEKPKVTVTKNTVITKDTTLHLDNHQVEGIKYYVYAIGSIQGSYTKPSEAIVMADQLMGVVISSTNQVVWERGGKFNRKNIAGIQMVPLKNGVNTVGASISMVLKYNLITKAAKELSESRKSIYGLLKENIQSPINLTDCNLEQVLYFVSGGKPVIAMKDSSQAVLITGYDEYYVTLMDPAVGVTRMTITSAGAMFEQAGNIFISYIN